MRILIIVTAVSAFVLQGIGLGAARRIRLQVPATWISKQWGLLAIQDGGRRKPMDTFAKETLIRITGRSTYTDKAGRTWRPNDFVLSALIGDA